MSKPTWRNCDRCGRYATKRALCSCGDEETRYFTTHGGYTVSNAIGYEVQLSKDNDYARARYNGDFTIQTTGWREIEYDTEGEPFFIAFGFEVYLNQVDHVSDSPTDKDRPAYSELPVTYFKEAS